MQYALHICIYTEVVNNDYRLGYRISKEVCENPIPDTSVSFENFFSSM